MVRAQRARRFNRELAVDSTWNKSGAAACARALAALRLEVVPGDVEALLSATASATVTDALLNARVLATRNPPNEYFVRLVSASVK
jgi:hypothetical protein